MHKPPLLTSERMAGHGYQGNLSPAGSLGFHTAPATPIPSSPVSPDDSPTSSSTSTSTLPTTASAFSKDISIQPGQGQSNFSTNMSQSSGLFHSPQWSSAMLPDRQRPSIPSPLSPRRSTGSPSFQSKTLDTVTSNGRTINLSSPSPKTLQQAAPQYVMKHGRLHHNYDPQEVPYSWPCDALECNRQNLFHLTVKTLHGNVSADMKHVPQRVLDIGTGTGIWVLDQAAVWPDAEILGLDVVPLFPNPPAYHHLQTPSQPNRVGFLLHNFLHGLPFPDKHFDFVHMRFCGMGIPEDKANALVEEIVRVTKVGGSVQIMDADIQVHLPTDREISPDVRRVTEEYNEWNRALLVDSRISPYMTSVWPPVLITNLQSVKRIDVTCPFSGIGTSSYTDASKTQRNMKASHAKDASVQAERAAAIKEAQDAISKGLIPGSDVHLSSLGYVTLYNLSLYISGLKSKLRKEAGLEEDEFDRRMVNYIRECESGENGEYVSLSIFYGQRGQD